MMRLRVLSVRVTPLLRHYSTNPAVASCPHLQGDSEWSSARPYSEIPGPKPLPIIGNIHRFAPVIGKYDFSDFKKVAKQLKDEYGNIVRITGVRDRDMVFLYDPNDFEKVFRNEGPWPIRPRFESFYYYRKVARKDFFENLGGVLLDNGKEWQQARTHANPVMMQTRTVQLYEKPISDVSEEFIKRIPKWLDNKNRLPDDFQNELYKWALESIAMITLNIRLGCLAPDLAPDSEPQKLIDAIQNVLERSQKLELGLPFWKHLPSKNLNSFISSFDYFVDVCMKYVNVGLEKAKRGEVDDSVLGRFLALDPNPKRAVIMALDMIGAGVDTTSMALINVLLQLSTNPEKQEKLYDEIQRLIPEPETPLTSELLNEMRYLRACVRESMRLQTPTISNARVTPADIVLSNYQIPKDTDILMPNLVLSYMDKYFPQADKFIPERWLRNAEENAFPEFKANPYVSLPFGHGARKCVGMRFASLEIEVLLAKLIRNFRWEWHEAPMRMKTRILYTPAAPLNFTVIKRN